MLSGRYTTFKNNVKSNHTYDLLIVTTETNNWKEKKKKVKNEYKNLRDSLTVLDTFEGRRKIIL